MPRTPALICPQPLIHPLGMASCSVPQSSRAVTRSSVRLWIGSLLAGFMLLSTPVDAGMLLAGRNYLMAGAMGPNRGMPVGWGVMDVIGLLTPMLAKHGPGPFNPSARVIRIDEGANGREVSASPGDLIEIRLRYAAGAPIAWASGSSRGTSVVQVGEARSEVQGPNIPGAPVDYVVLLQAVSAGTSQLEFELRPFFGEDAPPVRTFKVTLQVVSTSPFPRKN